MFHSGSYKLLVKLKDGTHVDESNWHWTFPSVTFGVMFLLVPSFVLGNGGIHE